MVAAWVVVAVVGGVAVAGVVGVWGAVGVAVAVAVAASGVDVVVVSGAVGVVVGVGVAGVVGVGGAGVVRGEVAMIEAKHGKEFPCAAGLYAAGHHEQPSQAEFQFLKMARAMGLRT